MDPERRLKRDQARRERKQQMREVGTHQRVVRLEKDTRKMNPSSQQVPLFGELIQRRDHRDELGQFAKNVLGDYDHAVKAIVTDFPNQKYLGIDSYRTRRLNSGSSSSGATSANSSHSSSHSQIREKAVAEAKSTPSMGLTNEKREEPMAASHTSTPLPKTRHSSSSSSSHKTSSTSSNKKVPKMPRAQSKSQPIKEPNGLPPPSTTPVPSRKHGQHRSKVYPYTKPIAPVPTTPTQHVASSPHSAARKNQSDLPPSQTQPSLPHSSPSVSAEKKLSTFSPTCDVNKSHKKHKKAKEKQQPPQQPLDVESPAEKPSRPHLPALVKAHTFAGTSPPNSNKPGSLLPIRRTSSTGSCLETLLSSINNAESGPSEGVKQSAPFEKAPHRKKEKKQKRVESENRAGTDSRPTFVPAAESGIENIPSFASAKSSRTVEPLQHSRDHLMDDSVSSTGIKLDQLVSPATGHHASGRQGSAHHHKHPDLTLNIHPKPVPTAAMDKGSRDIDLHSMLKEMTLPPSLTPISTPIEKDVSFSFPQSALKSGRSISRPTDNKMVVAQHKAIKMHLPGQVSKEHLPAPPPAMGKTPSKSSGIRRDSNSSVGSSSSSSESSSSGSSSESDSDSDDEDMDSQLNLRSSPSPAPPSALPAPSPITPAPEPTQPLSNLGDPVIPGIHLLSGSQATMDDVLEMPDNQEPVIEEHSSESSSDSSSSSEESSDTSDDSSSDEDEEEEEDEEGMGDDQDLDRQKPSQEGKEYRRHPLMIHEEGTSTMIENVKKELLPSVITPLKTPPAHFFPAFSHIAANLDESANLSPAKPQKTSALTHSMSSIKQENNSLGFMAASVSRSPHADLSSHPEGITELALATANAALGKFDADSSSCDDSSGEESDSESSDSDVEDVPPQSESVTGAGVPILKVEYDDVSQPQPNDLAWEEEIVSKNLFPIVSETGIDSDRHSASAKVHAVKEEIEHTRHPGKAKRKLEEREDKSVRGYQAHKAPRSIFASSVPLSEPGEIPDDKEENDRGFARDRAAKRQAEKEQQAVSSTVSTMMVQIPLSKVPAADLIEKKAKPQATVGPWNISSARKRTASEATDIDELAPAARRERHEASGMRYNMRSHDNSTNWTRDYHGSHREGDHHHYTAHRDRNRRNWSSEYSGIRRSERRSRDQDYRHSSRETDSWERERYGTTSPAHHRSSEDYWEYPPRRDGERSYSDRSMDNGSEYYFQRARNLKREADNILNGGVAKAVRYMESVVYFMCHAHALEGDTRSWEGGSAQNKAFKLYSDTISIIRHSMRVGSECKPLQAVCFRTQAVLYWHMYLIKQSQIHTLHKELNEHFSSSKPTQKSPYHPSSSLSPLPSPASVGSTTSSCSGAGPTSIPSSGAAQDQSVGIPRHIWSKVTDHLTLTNYAHQSLEAWKQSDNYVEPYRDLFSSVDRNCGKIAQFSSIPHVADWVEHILHCISSRWS